MFVRVTLLQGYTEPLWYSVPSSCFQQCQLGSIVQVPLRQRVVAAVVDRIAKERPRVPFQIREIVGFEEIPNDPLYLAFVKQLAAYYSIREIVLLKRLQTFIWQKEKKERISLGNVNNDGHTFSDVTLTQEQEAAVNVLLPSIQSPAYVPLLLHGVTGSGKTEVYKRLIVETIGKGRSVILLLPEVTLAVQFEVLLRNQLPQGITIFGFHSGTSIKQKRGLWKSLIAGKPVLIVGVHLPVLLPIANLGCIIVDEEHEVGYQEKKHPKINSKEAAILRAHRYGIPIVLGSGTPSITSYFSVVNKGWKYARLSQRFAGAFPQIEVVSLRDQKLRRNFWISTRLEQAIKRQLQRKEQTIIFLNRRGYSFFVQCKECADIVMCPNCSVSLTLHENNELACHYCGLHVLLPTVCAACKAVDAPFLKKGIGTQQVVSILQKTFPHARISRADLDTTVDKKKWQATMQAMQDGEIDILVGTQTITKGYHFPRVTLVGVLWADLNLHFPLYNAAETTLQQLIQVAGRAGRVSKESHVIIQTMLDHPIYAFLAEQSYEQFYEYELQKRKILNYPPFMRFAEIELKNVHEEELDREVDYLADMLKNNVQNNSVIVLGPAKPPVAKIKNIHTRKIYLKSQSMQYISALYHVIRHDNFKSQIFFLPNPLTC